MARPKVTYLERGHLQVHPSLTAQPVWERPEDAALPAMLRELLPTWRGRYFDVGEPPRQDIIETLKDLAALSDDEVRQRLCILENSTALELTDCAHRLTGRKAGREPLVLEADRRRGQVAGLKAVAGTRPLSEDEQAALEVLSERLQVLEAQLELDPRAWSPERVRRIAKEAIGHVRVRRKPRTTHKDLELIAELRCLWQGAGGPLPTRPGDPKARWGTPAGGAQWVDLNGWIHEQGLATSFTAFAREVFSRLGRPLAPGSIRGLDDKRRKTKG
jgi:hypothetical protein